MAHWLTWEEMEAIVVDPTPRRKEVVFDLRGRKWYYWEESYTQLYGPFKRYDDCLEGLALYAEGL